MTKPIIIPTMLPSTTECITPISTSIKFCVIDKYPPTQNKIAAINVVFLKAAAGSEPFFKKVIEKTPIIDAK